ncbi:pyridoxamine 5'-phosphate oxidase family protein [Chitinibacteraceae bacterium HSL-7]
MTQPPSARTRVRRIPERAGYDAATLYAVLDAGYLCHIAFTDEHGPHCLPMAYWRVDDALYIHGSNGSRMMKRLIAGAEVCIAVSHLDGIVLARSAFNHSMNYRSAVIYGCFEAVPDAATKSEVLDAFMDKLAPGRKDETRRGSPQELGATIVLRISLNEAVTKIRTGGPNDDEKDMHIAAWTGVLPYATVQTAPVPDADCIAPAPDYVRTWGSTGRGT